MRHFLLLVILLTPTFAAAEADKLIFQLRCDRALEMITDSSHNGKSVWLSEAENEYVNGFLLGFGLLSASKPPETHKEAIGAAIGGLVFLCETSPSRTLKELSAYFRRRE